MIGNVCRIQIELPEDFFAESIDISICHVPEVRN